MKTRGLSPVSCHREMDNVGTRKKLDYFENYSDRAGFSVFTERGGVVKKLAE